MILFFAFSYLSAKNQGDTDLIRKWYLNKYFVESVAYEPEKKEKDDFIEFKSNGTFEAQSEGIIEKGTWMPNQSGGYLELKDESGQTFKVYIISITEDVLILRYDIPEISDIQVKYVSNK